MSNLRIRYHEHKYKEGCVISGREFTSNRGAKYRIILNLEAMEYYIRNERTREYVKKSSYPYTNLNALKGAARRALGKLGVDLKKESRYRTFGLCTKGETQISHSNKKRKEKLEKESREKSAEEEL